MPKRNHEQLNAQLKKVRRTVDFDTFDIHVLQLLTMLEEGQIWVAPAYQRQFRWDDHRCSQLVESLLLGIPVPSLFMATNSDSTWEVVDGVQRLSSIVKFAGSEKLRKRLKLNGGLALKGRQKLTKVGGRRVDDLPRNLQLHLHTRPTKVVTLTDKSDKVVRYDLFERLNTGGISLTEQEIRDCVYQGPFADKLEELSKDPNFVRVVRLSQNQRRNGTAEECVLRYFALLAKYRQWVHSVKDFLNDYMEEASKSFDFAAGEAIFRKTFEQLAELFPEGIRRPNGQRRTPISLFEGIAVGAGLVLKTKKKLSTKGLDDWLASPELKSFTTGATNDKASVIGRIEFCRDRFAGKRYVSPASS